ncbi:hypothetical protein AVEN_80177-1 [Araneus ventricosus]|uniref:Uncharacterized protein n=1 Tax=Araneus ventricosus TaxID=182803 RepID=A0A4Y2L1V4_ARAVE|nr:hypothetical protein AVEN_80177-1 [Araneus ventricosus]
MKKNPDTTKTKEPRYEFLQRFPCDVTPCQEDYEYAAVRIDRERLWSSNAFEESLWSFVCSASWKAGGLSANESAVTVIISELLFVCVSRAVSAVTVIAGGLFSVCIDNLYKCYCSYYLCFVFAEYLYV